MQKPLIKMFQSTNKGFGKQPQSTRESRISAIFSGDFGKVKVFALIVVSLTLCLLSSGCSSYRTVGPSSSASPAQTLRSSKDQLAETQAALAYSSASSNIQRTAQESTFKRSAVWARVSSLLPVLSLPRPLSGSGNVNKNDP